MNCGEKYPLKIFFNHDLDITEFLLCGRIGVTSESLVQCLVGESETSKSKLAGNACGNHWQYKVNLLSTLQHYNMSQKHKYL